VLLVPEDAVLLVFEDALVAAGDAHGSACDDDAYDVDAAALSSASSSRSKSDGSTG
jgi:hypothetical protein